MDWFISMSGWISSLILAAALIHRNIVITKRFKTCGTIIVTEEDEMYLQIDNEESFKEIKRSKNVTFRVLRKNPQK